MGSDVTTQNEAWLLLDDLMAGAWISFVEEPEGLWKRYRERTNFGQVAPKIWADAYLAAFAETAGLTLVTFDRALAGSLKGSVLLS